MLTPTPKPKGYVVDSDYLEGLREDYGDRWLDELNQRRNSDSSQRQIKDYGVSFLPTPANASDTR